MHIVLKILIPQPVIAAGGARCIASLDVGIGGSSNSPWIVSGGKGGDITVHDFRYILSKKGRRPQSPLSSSSKNSVDESGRNGMLWHVSKAHSGNLLTLVVDYDSSNLELVLM